MSDILITGFKLFVITAVAATVLALTNIATIEPIRAQMQRAHIEAKIAVLPEAESFEQLDIAEYAQQHPMLLEVFEGSTDGEKKGYAFRIVSRGFAEMELFVGISNDGNISGVNIVRQRETPGLGTKATGVAFTGGFEGMVAQQPFALVRAMPGDSEIQAVSGATASSRAVLNAVNAAIEYYNRVIKER